jgi:tRNA uridine 5-carboxymethylaminomethyl modification enzyme
LLLTQRADTIGECSCNPSIGGIGKGTLVREIDALGGLMGKVADQSGIQFKVLNSSKGTAVHGPRGQMDRDIYKKNMVEALFGQEAKDETQGRLNLYQGSVHDLIVEDGKCVGVEMQDGAKLRSKSVVLTTGTFLAATCHIG